MKLRNQTLKNHQTMPAVTKLNHKGFCRIYTYSKNKLAQKTKLIENKGTRQ